MQISDKSRLATFLLAFFLGPLGIHRFYVGKIGSGIAMLLLTLTIIGMLATGIWSLVDWIMAVSGLFRDADGRLIKAW